MTAAAAAFLAVAAAFAVADWIAVSPPVSSRRVEYVAKPATTALLVAAAAFLDPADEAQRTLFLIALGLSLAGDVLLMLPSDAFAAGLGAFLLAHVAYSAGFSREISSGPSTAAAAALVLAFVVPVARRLIAGARASEQRLVVPVAVYVAAIGAMGTTALATLDAVAAAGAALFMASDSLIGWNRFVAPIPWVRPAIMATYHAGQALLVVSLNN